MRYKNYIINVEDVSKDQSVYVIRYDEFDEENSVNHSGYIGYVPDLGLYGLETYLRDNNNLFCYEYKTDSMGSWPLGIIKNDIKIDEDLCRYLSMYMSVFETYERFINSFESKDDILKLFEKLVIDYQL